MATTRLLLVRHGQSTWNAEGRWQGWADPPLSELGERQAADAAQHLRSCKFSAAVTSDLLRARRTGQILADRLGLGSVEVEADLRERDVGSFSGRTTAENRRDFPAAFDGEGVIEIPGGESAEQVLQRVVPALARVARRCGPGDLLIVTHGGVIRLLERHLDLSPPPATPNLGGRWFVVAGDGELSAGPALTPVSAEIETQPASE